MSLARRDSCSRSKSITLCVMVAAQLFSGLVAGSPRARADDIQGPPRQRTTVLGTKYMVDPVFDRGIGDRVATVRRLLAKERSEGKVVCYVSIPLSARGGGHLQTNQAISECVK